MITAAASVGLGQVLVVVLVLGLLIYGIAFVAARGAKRGGRE